MTTSQDTASVIFHATPSVDLLVEGVYKDYCTPTDIVARLPNPSGSPLKTSEPDRSQDTVRAGHSSINTRNGSVIEGATPTAVERQLLTASPKRFLFTGTAWQDGVPMHCRVPLQVQLETGKSYEFRFVSGLTVCAVEWREIIDTDQGVNRVLLRKFRSQHNDALLTCFAFAYPTNGGTSLCRINPT